MLLIYLITFISSIFLNTFFQNYFIKKNKFDEIKSRSAHKGYATRSGGIGIFTNLFLIILYFYILSNQFFDFSILIPIGILFTVGLYDDIYQVDFKLKFIFQLIVAKIMIDQGIIIESFNGFLGIYEIPYLLSQLITIFFIVFIINATNFTDGIDGLAITETVKCLMIVIFIGSEWSFNGYYFVFLIIILSVLPLYYFNFKRNYKVFLGDSGSLVLGGIVSIAIIVLLNDSVDSIIINSIPFPILIIFCYLYPIVDTTYVIIKRIINGHSPFIADKLHLHHILISRGMSHNKCLLIISGCTGIIQIVVLLSYITYLSN